MLLEKLEEIKKKLEKDLTQSKGFINSNFLKYKSCKTILRTKKASPEWSISSKNNKRKIRNGLIRISGPIRMTRSANTL
jgi:indole-3-glycerol phosphate synthase